MENKFIANYRVVIQPDQELGNGKRGFTAYVPKLGIADSGYTIEGAIKNVTEGIQCFIEALLKDHQSVPEPDNVEQDIITTTSIVIPAHLLKQFRSALAANVL